MLGTINGAYLNQFAVNSNSVFGLSFAELVFTQADATISAVGVSALNGAATYTEAAHVMAAAAVNALAAASLDALLADQVGAGSGTLAIAGAGAIQELDDLLAAAFKQILTRTALGADVLPHASGNRLTPHGRGNSVTVH